MKKLLAIFLTLMLVFCLTGCGGTTKSQGSDNADVASADNTKLGSYNVEIKGCRLAKDFEGKKIVIVNYGFTNNSDESSAFYTAISTEVYQDGIGLNECYFAADSANYNSDNQTKEIKKGNSLDVEVAYELNDTTTDIEVEVKEFFSFTDDTISKTFKISE